MIGSMYKRGLSAVIATVILILVTIIAVGIISSFIIPTVRDNLQQTGNCLDVVGKVELNPAFTCIGTSAGTFVDEGELIVSVETGKIKIGGLIVVVSGNGASKNYKIENGPYAGGDISMYRGSSNLILPGENEIKTYWISDIILPLNPTEVKIAPIMGGNQCEISDKIFLQNCPSGL